MLADGSGGEGGGGGVAQMRRQQMSVEDSIPASFDVVKSIRGGR
jgi:hypothetical protein